MLAPPQHEQERQTCSLAAAATRKNANINATHLLCHSCDSRLLAPFPSAVEARARRETSVSRRRSRSCRARCRRQHRQALMTHECHTLEHGSEADDKVVQGRRAVELMRKNHESGISSTSGSRTSRVFNLRDSSRSIPFLVPPPWPQYRMTVPSLHTCFKQQVCSEQFGICSALRSSACNMLQVLTRRYKRALLISTSCTAAPSQSAQNYSNRLASTCMWLSPSPLLVRNHVRRASMYMLEENDRNSLFVVP